MRIQLVVFTLFFTLASGVAHATGWLVERTTSNVQMSADGKTWQRVAVGLRVQDSYMIRTGPRARVVLAKGAERILYRGNTLAAISEPSARRTQITQQRGSILLSVSKSGRQQTTVRTPHLAAVVKGTVFEVTVGSERTCGSIPESSRYLTVGKGPVCGAAVLFPLGQARAAVCRFRTQASQA